MNSDKEKVKVKKGDKNKTKKNKDKRQKHENIFFWLKWRASTATPITLISW